MKTKSNFLTDENSLKTIDRHRIIYVFVAILFFFITEVGRHVYRPYIYENDINDYGIADSIGNLGGIVVQIFFSLAILNSPGKKAFNLIFFLMIGYIIYEILQPYLPKGVFDWKDIYGTILGGFISGFILIAIRLFIKNKVIYKFGN